MGGGEGREVEVVGEWLEHWPKMFQVPGLTPDLNTKKLVGTC